MISYVGALGLLVAILFSGAACNPGGSPTPTVGPSSATGTRAAPVPTAVPALTPVAETRAPPSPSPSPSPVAVAVAVAATVVQGSATPVLVQTATSVPPTSVPPGPVSPVRMSPLMESLAVTPLAFADSPILFADYAGSRAATGLEDVQGIDDVFSVEGAMERIYEGVAIDDDFLSGAVTLRDRVGLDVYAFDRSIWSSEPKHEAPGFLLIQGKFDIENVIDNLMELDYTNDSHGGADYYRLGDDFGYSIAHPLRRLGLTLNRVARLDPWLAAARSTGTIAGLIGVQRDEKPSILVNDGHRVLAEAVGEGLLSGAYMPPQWIVENWNTVNAGPVDRLDRYTVGAEQWGRLSPYSLALLGYRVREDAEETVVALFYPDPEAAGNDAPELERRWNSFHYDPSTGLLAEPEPEETPVTRSCSPFSTTVIRQAAHSVLVGTCPVLRGEDLDPTAQGPSLWLWLFGARELQFLVGDLEAIRE